MVQRGLGSEVGTLMKKKELLGLPALRATKKILSLAMADKLMMRTAMNIRGMSAVGISGAVFLMVF